MVFLNSDVTGEEPSVSSPSMTIPASIRAGWDGRAIKLLTRSMTS
ncbi:BZ3500_MvSof-1268-A1-R1_Chr8-2g10107 [Microbotryum saponariae]|uniref:BZ3500_MvSof-1268-A1-R1_Chr8-2g10107 protein n=1 Tax=Microbotryum saponariae TaxID=289078 RepID=A0A2X0L570_9BASI|nr:BZ3500_MvSof-1268-A1-R1_Chr8-2g10107 [Microbotryum saponariae]SDA01801.1 BZ3501_MvSof-1269-A2-R1_Chr8-2g09858 [Microbotryum saponariae]